MVILYGSAGRLIAKNGGCRPGQIARDRCCYSVTALFGLAAGRGVTLPRAALVTRGISYISVVILIFVYFIRDSYEAERPTGG